MLEAIGFSAGVLLLSGTTQMFMALACMALPLEGKIVTWWMGDNRLQFFLNSCKVSVGIIIFWTLVAYLIRSATINA